MFRLSPEGLFTNTLSISYSKFASLYSHWHCVLIPKVHITANCAAALLVMESHARQITDSV
jgi:hypothetical protein